jgi:hypothetical protein
LDGAGPTGVAADRVAQARRVAAQRAEEARAAERVTVVAARSDLAAESAKAEGAVDAIAGYAIGVADGIAAGVFAGVDFAGGNAVAVDAVLEVVDATNIVTGSAGWDALVGTNITDAWASHTEARCASTNAVGAGFPVGTLLVGATKVVRDGLVAVARKWVIPLPLELVGRRDEVVIRPRVGHADTVRAHHTVGTRMLRIAQRFAIPERQVTGARDRREEAAEGSGVL